MEQNLTVDTFEEQIKSIGTPVIVDFYATWCGPCKMMAPVLEKVKSQYGESIAVVKIDIDEHKEIASKYEIMSIPTLMFFLNGELIRREIGFIPQEKLFEIIDEDLCVLKK